MGTIGTHLNVSRSYTMQLMEKVWKKKTRRIKISLWDANIGLLVEGPVFVVDDIITIPICIQTPRRYGEVVVLPWLSPSLIFIYLLLHCFLRFGIFKIVHAVREQVGIMGWSSFLFLSTEARSSIARKKIFFSLQLVYFCLHKEWRPSTHLFHLDNVCSLSGAAHSQYQHSYVCWHHLGKSFNWKQKNTEKVWWPIERFNKTVMKTNPGSFAFRFVSFPVDGGSVKLSGSVPGALVDESCKFSNDWLNFHWVMRREKSPFFLSSPAQYLEI